MTLNYLGVVFLLFLSFALFGSDFEKRITERIDELENELLDLQIHTYQKSPICLSGEFNTVFQYIDFNPKTGSNLTKDQFHLGLSEFRLNLNKTDSKRVKFYSTLSSTYVWNNTFQAPKVSTLNATDTVKGPQLLVEKAFLDIFSKQQNFSLSLGRLPTMYGPPLHHSTGQSRMGTYPGLLYSVPADGVSVNTNLSKVFNLDFRAMMRFIYTPFFNSTGVPQSSVAGREAPFAGLKLKAGNSFILNFEFSNNQNWSDWLFILQAYDVTFGRAKSMDGVRANLLPKDQLASNETTDRNIYEIGSTDKKSTRIRSVTAHFELSDILQTKFDFYTTLKYSRVSAGGGIQAVVTESHTDTLSGAPLPVGHIIDIGNFIYNEDSKAQGMLLGLKYSFNRRSSLGAEYLSQSHGIAPWTIRTPNFNPMYNTVGQSFHFFYNRRLMPDLYLNLGFVDMISKSSIDDRFFYERMRRESQLFYSALRYRF